ncbi:hypothetical protein NEHOM01_0507 [Nematocida homosporus]|uniref:uncharacterized protein n=1 Tax=Nematocida homosporus TaxID=1912981 RepID=UPI00221F4BB4|nr:uncharacterized protein NEHOM01_0507 [Nematocida homosporus]KAI5184956.1 hypothetical protein NEHOM01_0507 [Nematocida homosporus]
MIRAPLKIAFPAIYSYMFGLLQCTTILLLVSCCLIPVRSTNLTTVPGTPITVVGLDMTALSCNYSQQPVTSLPSFNTLKFSNTHYTNSALIYSTAPNITNPNPTTHDIPPLLSPQTQPTIYSISRPTNISSLLPLTINTSPSMTDQPPSPPQPSILAQPPDSLALLFGYTMPVVIQLISTQQTILTHIYATPSSSNRLNPLALLEQIDLFMQAVNSMFTLLLYHSPRTYYSYEAQSIYDTIGKTAVACKNLLHNHPTPPALPRQAPPNSRGPRHAQFTYRARRGRPRRNPLP